jgi:hypothetical protein
MIYDDFYGDRFRWFVGVVKDIGDDRSRVRVRIFGIHHTEDLENVSDGDLPWAQVLYPTTGGQTSGGNVSHNLVPGSWVVGFFLDGNDSQQPIVLGVINGGQGSVNSSPEQRTNFDAGSPTQNSSNPAGTIDQNTGTPTTTQLEGNSNVQKVYNYFWQKIKAEGALSGDLKVIVSAIIGNLQQESGQNINPQAWNPSDRGEVSGGIAQWRAGKYDRLNPLMRFSGYNSRPSRGSLPPLEKQLDFMWHELHTSERSAYNKLLTSTTIEDAVAAIIHFERDESYRKINGVWTVDRTNGSYRAKLNNARKILSSVSYTGSANSGTPSS